MDIIGKIKPLYDDLVNIGLPDFFKESEFIRIANKLNITNLYFTALKEIEDAPKQDWNFLFGTSYTDVLANFLNKIFTHHPNDFATITGKIVEDYLPHSHYISSIAELMRDLELLGCHAVQLEAVEKAWHKRDSDMHTKAVYLKNILTSRATGGSGDDQHYKALRISLLSSQFKTHVPDFVKNNDDLNEFWQFIKYHLQTYAERRFFIKDAFAELINATSIAPSHSDHTKNIMVVAGDVNEKYISETWEKALHRMNDDPEAAITSARSLIETVCKYILDNSDILYDDGVELPKLYKQTATALNLAPDQHTEAIFKQILGGCQSVVEALGALRNKLGDAHGGSIKKVRPSKRHAALAVNLSGTMCNFLLETYLHLQAVKSN